MVHNKRDDGLDPMVCGEDGVSNTPKHAADSFDVIERDGGSVEKMLIQSGWVPDGIQPNQQPRVVEDVESFIQEGFYGDHMNDVVVLKDGIRKLGMANDVPDWLASTVPQSSTIWQVLEDIGPEVREKIDARVYYFNDGREREHKYKDSNGNELETLQQKWEELQRGSESGETYKNLYLTEMRYTRKHKYRHAGDGDWARTAMKTDIKDYVGKKAQIMPYWDRYNEGIFIGCKHTGSPLHMDQCLWSNFGKNFYGYKLLAIWNYDVITQEELEPKFRQLFDPPLSRSEREVMSKACKLVLVSPGDVFIFSGANPHMALCISDELSLTAYESFVNLNPRHINVLCDSNQEPQHHEEFHMSSRTLEDVKLDVVDAVNDNLDRIERGELNPEDEEAINTVAEIIRRRDSFMAEDIRIPRSKRPRDREESDDTSSPNQCME